MFETIICSKYPLLRFANSETRGIVIDYNIVCPYLTIIIAGSDCMFEFSSKHVVLHKNFMLSHLYCVTRMANMRLYNIR